MHIQQKNKLAGKIYEVVFIKTWFFSIQALTLVQEDMFEMSLSTSLTNENGEARPITRDNNFRRKNGV